MTTSRSAERPRTLAVLVGLAVIGLAVGLGAFITANQGDLHPPEDMPRAVAIPALYFAIGVLAIVGGIQRRPTIVGAAGGLCLVGTVLSIATIVFLVPGVALLAASARMTGTSPRRGRSEAPIAALSIVLVVGAAIALLTLTQERCWQASGSQANPTYAAILCSSRPTTVGTGGSFASGADSGDLTVAGGLVEFTLLGAMFVLVVLSGRRRAAG